MDGEDARIVMKPALLQDVQRPFGLSRDGPAWGAVSFNMPSRRILNDSHRPLSVPLKFVRAQLIDALMPVAMAGDLMPAGQDFSHKFGEALGYPANEKECCPGLIPFQQIQNPPGVCHYSGWPLLPRIR